MKTIKRTTAIIASPIDRIKLKGIKTVPITDKAMSYLEVEEIEKGEVKSLTVFNVWDDETGEEYEQCVISTDTANYSACAESIVSLVSELIDIVNEDSATITLNDIGIKFYRKTTKNGNNITYILSIYDISKDDKQTINKLLSVYNKWFTGRG